LALIVAASKAVGPLRRLQYTNVRDVLVVLDTYIIIQGSASKDSVNLHLFRKIFI
jgi:hypothetical protein